MTKVYVTEMPKDNNDCPFHSNPEPNCCTITGKSCCLETKSNCEHLATFFVVEGSANDKS